LKAQIINPTYINYGGVLDLNTTSLLFGEASSLQQFEQYLNEPDIQASNLDLNNDGYIDYLKVTGLYENNRYIIQIYSLLGMNQYKNIASIIVRNINYRNPSIIIEGDPTIYGPNYILSPNYSRRPDILWSFSSLTFNRWNSPYYWGYYPRNYKYHRIIGLGDYYRQLNIRFGFNYPKQYYDNRNWSYRHYNNKYYNQSNNRYKSQSNNRSNNQYNNQHNNRNYNSNYNNNKEYYPSASHNKIDRTAPANIRYRSPSVNTPSKRNQAPNNNSRIPIKKTEYTHPKPTGTYIRGTQNTSKSTGRSQSVSTHPKATGTSIRGTKSTSKSTKSTSTKKSRESTKTTSPVRR